MLSQGRILGGSSAINGLVYTPPSKTTIDAWVKLGNTGWEWEKFEQSLNKSRTLTCAADPGTTGHGPLQLWLPDISNDPWPKAWSGALKNLGFSPSGHVLSEPSVGTVVNPDTVNPATGERSYAASAYLDAARQRDNLTIVTGASVRRVLFERTDGQDKDPAAIGVEYNIGDETKVALAHREVILSAGTFNSSRLLELSGIGARHRLEKLGIEVVVETPFVGENLQCHAMCAVSFESDDKALESLLAREENGGTNASKYKGTGLNVAAYLPLPGTATLTGAADLENMLKSGSDELDGSATGSVSRFAALHTEFVQSILKDKEGISGYYVATPNYVPVSGPPSPGDETYFSIVLLLPHPLSRGSAHITSRDSLAIDPRFLSHPLDVEVLARHLCQMEDIVATQPLAKGIKQGGKRNPAAEKCAPFRDLETAKAYLRQTAVGAHHYTGTCSMMAREYGGVVDEELRVYGCRNLRVCDASIIPITPPANPQATVYAVAEHGASIIMASL
jgi:choline dehydrogenase-like flavoprotein